jgi:hypothetical protein
VVQGWLVPGDGIYAPRWLDELTTLNQPPQVDDRNAIPGQVFRTHQSHPLHQLERLLGFCRGSHVLLIGCSSKEVHSHYYSLLCQSITQAESISD